MKILAVPGVYDYLDELITNLHQKGYFAFEDSAIEYVNDLIYEINTNLIKKRHRPAPTYYNKYGKGMYYASFVRNRHTTWYVFFTKYRENGETIYLIHHIGNNHTEAQYLNR